MTEQHAQDEIGRIWELSPLGKIAVAKALVEFIDDWLERNGDMLGSDAKTPAQE